MILSGTKVSHQKMAVCTNSECSLALPDQFFFEKKARSAVKARIVAKYFQAWANVVRSASKARGGKIAYIDLFAGPGRYVDGSISTPLMILEQAIADNDLSRMLVSIFNDRDGNHTHALQSAIRTLPNVSRLKHQPIISTADVNEEIVKHFEQMKFVPTFFFVDPWGYKGLSLRLVHSVLKDWGCDCVFFFNYNRINMGLTNPMVSHHMNALFGEDRVISLRTKLKQSDPATRESVVSRSIREALVEVVGQFVQPFCFKDESGARTSHYLVFVTKHFKGYEVMKAIMASESSSSRQGVASFVYNPRELSNPLLIDLARPLDELEKMLSVDFAGKRPTMRQIYEKHSVGTPYLSRNYKDALLRLEKKGYIEADPPASNRRRGTFGDSVQVTFRTR
jgi:three-Cys-motif partner protein